MDIVSLRDDVSSLSPLPQGEAAPSLPAVFVVAPAIADTARACVLRATAGQKRGSCVRVGTDLYATACHVAHVNDNGLYTLDGDGRPVVSEGLQVEDETGAAPAVVVAYDVAGDCAILSAPGLAGPAAALAAATHSGEALLAVGFPAKGPGKYLTAGVLSAEQPGYVWSDAAINPGNSGGALFNAAGELVGIASFVMREQGGPAPGLGAFASVTTVRRLLASLAATQPPTSTIVYCAAEVPPADAPTPEKKPMTPEEIKAIVDGIVAALGPLLMPATPEMDATPAAQPAPALNPPPAMPMSSIAMVADDLILADLPEAVRPLVRQSVVDDLAADGAKFADVKRRALARVDAIRVAFTPPAVVVPETAPVAGKQMVAALPEAKPAKIPAADVAAERVLTPSERRLAARDRLGN